MRTITVRLKSGQYFREGIEEVVVRHGVAAGVILSAVGGVQYAFLRMPKQDSGEHTVKKNRWTTRNRFVYRDALSGWLPHSRFRFRS